MIGWIVTFAVYLALLAYGIISVWGIHKYFKDETKDQNNRAGLHYCDEKGE